MAEAGDHDSRAHFLNHDSTVPRTLWIFTVTTHDVSHGCSASGLRPDHSSTEGTFINNLPPNLGSCWLAWQQYWWPRPEVGDGESSRELHTTADGAVSSRRNKIRIVLWSKNLGSIESEKHRPYWHGLLRENQLLTECLLRTTCTFIT